MLEFVIGMAIGAVIIWLVMPKPPPINYEIPDLGEIGKQLERTRKEDANGTA